MSICLPQPVSNPQFQYWERLELLEESHAPADVAADILDVLAKVDALMGDDTWCAAPEHGTAVERNLPAVVVFHQASAIAKAQVGPEVVHYPIGTHHGVLIGCQHVGDESV